MESTIHTGSISYILYMIMVSFESELNSASYTLFLKNIWSIPKNLPGRSETNPL